MSAPRASLVIATRNRLEELRALLASAAAQTVPVEVLVMDDGASDEVARMVGGEFPAARYFRLGTGMGPAFQRNRGIELAGAPIAFPLDDDALLVSPRTVEQTLAEFDDPVVAAVGIPFVNVRFEQQVRQRAPTAGEIWVGHAFVGAAHALRRDVFLALGGFREHFFYMGEEGDLGVRMLEAGYVVRFGCADEIHHLESPHRNLKMADYCGRRNDILFAWHNVPGAMLPVHLAATTLNGLRSALGAQNPGRALLGILHGYLACFSRWRERRPVPSTIYHLHRRLKKSGPIALAQIRDRLPPARAFGGATAMIRALKRLLPDRPTPLTIRRGPFRGARVLMRPRSSMRKVLGLYEHELNAWLEAALARVTRVIDVGANDGYFTFGALAAFRRLGKRGQVIALEPQAALVEVLRETAALQGIGSGELTLVNAFAGAHAAAGVTTLDTLGLATPEPTLIKIDVEGAELDVIDGARTWLEPRNLFVIEVHREEFLAQLTDTFARRGIRLTRIDQQPLPLIGREVRDEANWWLVSDLGQPSGATA